MKADTETDKLKKEFLISVLKIHSTQADSYYANRTAKGKWEIGTSNDYPMQHGDGDKFILTDKLVDSFMSIKVAEAKQLPKDWDEVYDKFKENYKNSEHILHPINFLSWLKQHYSNPLSASEHRTIKEVLDLFEAIRDCDEEDWLHNRYRMSVILKELQASVSEQSPDGYVQECMILNSKDELIKQTSSKVVPVYFSPQPKVSEVCSRCGYETGFINNLK